ncbi:MAG: hypothetical protein ACHQUC_06065 [Chlamydiales bacterium]
MSSSLIEEKSGRLTSQVNCILSLCGLYGLFFTTEQRGSAERDSSFVPPTGK